jgi:hypothetical protein
MGSKIQLYTGLHFKNVLSVLKTIRKKEPLLRVEGKTASGQVGPLRDLTYRAKKYLRHSSIGKFSDIFMKFKELTGMTFWNISEYLNQSCRRF